MQPNGLEEAACDPRGEHPQRRLYFWYTVFYLSKIYEFVDTAILCLRKVPSHAHPPTHTIHTHAH
jgi:hypothetical protein